MVKDASDSHLLEQLVLANTCQGCVVGRGPQTSLHQDSQRRTVQQGCNGDQAEQVDAINVLQVVQLSSVGLTVPTVQISVKQALLPWSLADTSGEGSSGMRDVYLMLSLLRAEQLEHMHRHIIAM